MNLVEITPEKTPELFYAGYNEDLQQWEETQDLSRSEDEIHMRSACRHQSGKPIVAYQEMVLGSGKMQLWYFDDDNVDGILVAEGYVQQENETSPEYWEPYFFTNFQSEKKEKDKTHSKVNKGELSVADETASIDIDITWQNNNKKQLYIAKHKTEKLRVRATIKMLVPELCTYDYSDFITHDVIENPYEVDGVQYVDILFAPEGVYGELEVDPYLSIDEQSTYIDVTCDGYILRILTTNDVVFAYIYDLSSTELYSFQSSLYISSTEERFNFSTFPGISLNKTPTYFQIRIIGVYGGGITNLDRVEFVFHVFSDRFVIETIFEVSSTGFTIDSSGLYNFTQRWYGSSLSSVNAVVESGGSEIDATTNTDYAPASYGYITTIATELNLQAVLLDSNINGTATLNYRFYYGEDRPELYLNNGTITAGTTRFATMWVVDTAEREGSAKLYTSTERLEMGDQYTDTTMADPTTGSWVDDLVIPANVGVDGFSADGAIHIEPDSSDEIEFDCDITRHKQAIVVHDFPFYSGTVGSETDYLSEHFECDDNAANSTVTATTGNNANYEAQSDGSNRNTSTDSTTTTAVRNRAFDLGGAAYIDLATGNYLNAFFVKGGLLLEINPQFAYNVASDQTIFHCYISANDYLLLVYDAGNDMFEFRVSWGGTLLTLQSSVYTTDADLQQWTKLAINWDAGRDFANLILNGSTVDTGSNTGTPSGSNPSKITIGAMQDRTLPGDFIVDNIKSFDDTILPYGAYFTGNGSVDTDLAHDDILFYWDCENTITPQIITSETAPTVSGTMAYSSTAEDVVHGTYGADLSAAGDVDFTIDEDLRTQGSILLWARWDDDWSTYDDYFELRYDDNNRIYFTIGGDIEGGALRYVGAGTNRRAVFSGFDFDKTIMSCFVFSWKYNEYLRFYHNGVLISEDTLGTWTAMTTAPNIFRIAASGRDQFIDQVFITSSPNTPQIPCASGVPLHVPLIEVA